MSRRLNTYVHVHQDDGRATVYGPNDDIPDEDAAKITNPHVWATEEPTQEVEIDPPDPDDPPQAYDPVAGPPPKTGTGSSREAWLAYAAYHQVEHPDDATKKDIIAAIELAGAPTG